MHIIYTIWRYLGTNFVISPVPQMAREENRNTAESHKMYREMRQWQLQSLPLLVKLDPEKHSRMKEIVVFPKR